jgi:hypothetical protein
MTVRQAARIKDGLARLYDRDFRFFLHGDCIGADEEAHAIAAAIGYEIHIHPCDIAVMRARCDAMVIHPPKPPLDRNRDIVRGSLIMTAAPGEAKEVLRSGTWATIRFARRLDRQIYIVRPDGSMCE